MFGWNQNQINAQEIQRLSQCVSELQRRIFILEKPALKVIDNKPKSIKDISRNLVTMIDGEKQHTFTVHRVKGRFSKKPK